MLTAGHVAPSTAKFMKSMTHAKWPKETIPRNIALGTQKVFTKAWFANFSDLNRNSSYFAKAQFMLPIPLHPHHLVLLVA